ncbi:MAG: MgtC/SapB family protein [Chitinophagales bacterium]|nr:MgtC/SapB family protein [Chitinophagales bacterium]
MEAIINWNEIAIRLLLASLFGGFIGWERERKDWAAGLRTHMMVCVGACLVMIVSSYGFTDILNHPDIDLDPSRVAAQVVSGIGFIGAGAIIFSKQGTVRGLTTAAGLWTVAAIGLATGGGLYFAAGMTTFVALVILWGIQPIEQRFFKKYRHMTLRVIAQKEINHSALLKRLLVSEKFKVQSFSLDKEGDDFVFLLEVSNVDISRLDEIVQNVEKEEAVKEVFWAR